MQQALNEILLGKRAQKQLVVEISDLLGLSKDGVYRRLRGDTLYTIEEAMRIASHYQVSMDELMGRQSNFVTFRRSAYIKGEKEFEAYLEESLRHLEHFSAREGSHLYYSAKDVPIYYQFGFPELGRFKMFVWLNSLYDGQGADKGVAEVSDKMMHLAKNLYLAYMSVPCTEIWNDTTILSLFRQLVYYVEAELISENQALLILDEAEEMIAQIFRQATQGQRVGESRESAALNVPFTMYYHEILIMDNHIYFKSGDERRLFLPWGGLNFISTEDEAMMEQMELFLHNQHARSSLISGTAEKERIRWKRRAQKLLEETRARFKAESNLLS